MDYPQRKLQRLKNYDYKQNGAYFITICTQSREHLFGSIDNGKLILTNAGKMIFDKFSEISEFYTDIIVDIFIVMPNHLHAILLIQHDKTGTGAYWNGTGAYWNGTGAVPYDGIVRLYT